MIRAHRDTPLPAELWEHDRQRVRAGKAARRVVPIEWRFYATGEACGVSTKGGGYASVYCLFATEREAHEFGVQCAAEEIERERAKHAALMQRLKQSLVLSQLSNAATEAPQPTTEGATR